MVPAEAEVSQDKKQTFAGVLEQWFLQDPGLMPIEGAGACLHSGNCTRAAKRFGQPSAQSLYPTLGFYCNWAVHTSLDKTPAPEFVNKVMSILTRNRSKELLGATVPFV
jgi:hypothetical protein